MTTRPTNDDKHATCEDCGGSGEIVTLPEDKPTYWSDLANGVYAEDCTTCDTTGTVPTVYA